MGDSIITKDQLIEAGKNADAWEKYWAGSDDENVITRLNKEYPTHAKALKVLMENGGMQPFQTEVELLASVPIVEPTAAKALDTKKAWLWKDGAWVDTGLSELELAQISVDNTQQHSVIVTNAVNDVLCNLVDPAKCELGYIDTTGKIENTDSYKDQYISTGFIPVLASKNIQMWASKGQAAWLGRIAYYDTDKKFIGFDEFNGSVSITSLAIPLLKNNRTPFYIRLSNKTAYHTGADLYVGIASDNPKYLASFDLQRLFHNKKSVNEQFVKQIDNSKAVITAQNLLNNHTNNGTIGYLNITLEPNRVDAEYSKWWVTTDWLDIPKNSTHLVILGNIFSYSIKNIDDQWFAGETNELNVTANMQTLIDLSKTTHGGTGIAKKIRLSFRRLDIDASTLKAIETLSKCAVYAVRNSVGHIAESISLPSFTSDLSTLNTVQLSNLFNVCAERIYPISGINTGFIKGYYDQSVLVTTGQYVESWRTSPFIVCVSNLEYELINNIAYSVVYFDASHAFISSEYLANKQKFTVPANAVYLRISVSAANVSSCALYALPKVAIAQPIFAEKSTVVATKETLSALAAAPEISKLTDKKWLALGDSITNHASSYANQLAVRHGANLTKFTLDGTWVHAGTLSGIPRVLSNAISTAEFDNTVTDKVFDVITIACGVNDRFDGFEGNTNAGKLGTMADRGTDTFYGALHTIITTLRNKYPFARIGYITQIQSTWQAYNRGDMTTLAYCKTQAILDVCNYYGVPVWIGCEQFGFNPRDSQTLKDHYMPDGLHPNFAGHTWYANRVEDFILNLAK